MRLSATAGRRPDPYLLACAALVALMAAVTVQGRWGSDFWTHSATLAELIAAPGDPTDPLVGGDTTFPYFSPYLLALAGLARLTGLGAVTTLELVGLPVLVFVLWAVRRFVAVFSARGTQPRVAALFLVFTLLLWGVRPWFYSGMFNLGTLSLALAWPSLLAFGLMLTVWRALCDLCRRSVAWFLAGAGDRACAPRPGAPVHGAQHRARCDGTDDQSLARSAAA